MKAGHPSRQIDLGVALAQSREECQKKFVHDNPLFIMDFLALVRHA